MKTIRPLWRIRILVTLIASTLLSGCTLLRQFSEHEDVPPLDVSTEFRKDPSRTQQTIATTKRAPLPPPPLEVTREVVHELDSLLQGDAQCIRVSLMRSAPIYPTLVEIFTDEGVPLDLINLAVVESRFSPTARSRAGAVGLWQFTRSTARMYGLKIDSKRDQRTDIILSTIAAARLLRDLYLKFEDWYLALAAYNAGIGGVQRALRRGKRTDFWSIARSGGLTRQTREFVPRFIAATILMNTAKLHGVESLSQHVAERLTKHGVSLEGTSMERYGVHDVELPIG